MIFQRKGNRQREALFGEIETVGCILGDTSSGERFALVHAVDLDTVRGRSDVQVKVPTIDGITVSGAVTVGKVLRLRLTMRIGRKSVEY